VEQALKKKLEAATAEAKKAKEEIQAVTDQRDQQQRALSRATLKHKEELAKRSAEAEARDAALVESKA